MREFAALDINNPQRSLLSDLGKYAYLEGESRMFVDSPDSPPVPPPTSESITPNFILEGRLVR